MNVSSFYTKYYEQITMNNEPEKQTQSNPILSRRSIGEGGFKRDLVKMGHHKDMSWIFCCKMGKICLQYVQRVGWGLYPTNSSMPSTGIWPLVLKIGISEIRYCFGFRISCFVFQK